MKDYANLRKLFEEETLTASTVEMLTNRRYYHDIREFLKHCNLFIIDAISCGSDLLTLASAVHTKAGFTVTTIKGTKGHLSPDLFIQLIRNEGKNGLNILLNCPLGLSIQLDEQARRVLFNFGNWAFSDMTPVTEWGKIMLGKEMGLELREISLQLFELSSLTKTHLINIHKLIKKLKTP